MKAFGIADTEYFALIDWGYITVSDTCQIWVFQSDTLTQESFAIMFRYIFGNCLIRSLMDKDAIKTNN